jgi:hypothetical protein
MDGPVSYVDDETGRAHLIVPTYRPPIEHPCRACGASTTGYLCSTCAAAANRGE